ncbi:MAG: zinc-binding dehydrogenase, partial [Planctomycetales bacterium]|nr:zinc-binding dehydrogenase [Planctomycetales bacterium]
MQTGQKVFIPAGSGGIGTFAIQLAKHLGASVGTTTSTSNVDFVRSLGADEVVDYKKQHFKDVLNNYDHVLGTLKGETIEKSLPLMKSGGKVVSLVRPHTVPSVRVRSSPPPPAAPPAVSAFPHLPAVSRLCQRREQMPVPAPENRRRLGAETRAIGNTLLSLI